MKKNAFTLIELLAVISVLGIILTIVIISTNSIINDSAESTYQLQVNNIEEAARAYYLQEGMNSNATCVSTDELISKGYIEGKEVIDPKTRKPMTGYVKITYVSNQYSYEYQEQPCE